MTTEYRHSSSNAPFAAAPLRYMALAIATGAVAACATGGSQSGVSTPSPAADMSMTAPNPDPRVGLRAGWYDAGEAIWNLGVVSKTKPSKDFTNPSTPGDRRLVNSDLAFVGNYVIQGNYIGVNSAGTSAQGNSDGIYLATANNSIGGTTAATRNVIAGNRIGSYCHRKQDDTVNRNLMFGEVGGQTRHPRCAKVLSRQKEL